MVAVGTPPSPEEVDESRHHGEHEENQQCRAVHLGTVPVLGDQAGHEVICGHDGHGTEARGCPATPVERNFVVHDLRRRIIRAGDSPPSGRR
jgi:hypothetical protein